MPFPRASGILLHPTSLPSRGGICDFGPSAYAFADFLSSARPALFKLDRWTRWPRELAHRDPVALDKAHAEMLDELDVRRAVQFFFFEQWQALRAYCARHSIRVVGDIAIFVNFDSADVWTHPDLFRLNSDLDPEVIADVPPDFFSADVHGGGEPL